MLRMTISAALVAGIVMAGEALAAPPASGSLPQPNSSAPNQAPLPPAGRVASIREAQGVGRTLLYWAGAGALIIAGVILIAGDDNGTSTTTTTGN